MTRSRLTRRQRLAVGLASATRAASGGMLGTALVVFVGREGSPFAVSMLAATFFFATMVFSPMWGVLGDLTGRRRSLLVGASAVTTASMLAFVAVESVWGLIGMRGLYAVFAVGFGPLMLSVVGSLAGREHRGRSAGFFHSSLAVGDMGGQALLGVLLGVLAPSSLYVAIAAIGFLTTVAVVLLDDSPGGTRSDETQADGATLREVLAGVRTRLLPDARERRHLSESGLGWLYVALALRHMSVKGVGSLVPIYLLATVGVSEVAMGLLLALGPAAQIGFNTLFGGTADTGNRKWLIVFGIAASGCYGLVLAAAAVPTAALVGMAAAGAGFVVIAAGFSAMDIGVIALLGDAVPASRESSFIGLRSTASGVGGVVGPLAVGVIASISGVPTAFVAVSALAFVAAAIVVRTLEEPERVTSADPALRSVETAIGIDRPVGADDD